MSDLSVRHVQSALHVEQKVLNQESGLIPSPLSSLDPLSSGRILPPYQPGAKGFLSPLPPQWRSAGGHFCPPLQSLMFSMSKLPPLLSQGLCFLTLVFHTIQPSFCTCIWLCTSCFTKSTMTQQQLFSLSLTFPHATQTTHTRGPVFPPPGKVLRPKRPLLVSILRLARTGEGCDMGTPRG